MLKALSPLSSKRKLLAYNVGFLQHLHLFSSCVLCVIQIQCFDPFSQSKRPYHALHTYRCCLLNPLKVITRMKHIETSSKPDVHEQPISSMTDRSEWLGLVTCLKRRGTMHYRKGRKDCCTGATRSM